MPGKQEKKIVPEGHLNPLFAHSDGLPCRARSAMPLVAFGILSVNPVTAVVTSPS